MNRLTSRIVPFALLRTAAANLPTPRTASVGRADHWSVGSGCAYPSRRYFKTLVEEEALLELPVDEEPEEDELQFLRDRQTL